MACLYAEMPLADGGASVPQPGDGQSWMWQKGFIYIDQAQMGCRARMGRDVAGARHAGRLKGGEQVHKTCIRVLPVQRARRKGQGEDGKLGYHTRAWQGTMVQPGDFSCKSVTRK